MSPRVTQARVRRVSPIWIVFILVLKNFGPAAARAMGGPQWRLDQRVAAAERASALPLPSAELEDWRYSPIGELDLDRFEPSLGSLAGAPADTTSRYASAYVLRLHNGEIVSCALGAGVTVVPLADARGAEGLLAGEPHDALDALNVAFAQPLVLDIATGVELAQPIVIESWHSGEERAHFPRLVVRAGANSSAQIVQHSYSVFDDQLIVPVVEIEVGRDARFSYLDVQELGAHTWQLGRQTARVQSGATYTGATASFGGDYARLRSECHLVGRGATGNLSALYFGNRDQTLDFRTLQVHADRDTTSNLLFKGAVDDRARAIYTGLIQVKPNGRGTNAFQTNRNLKLSEDAWAESVPNLEIENNDVRCSHASTVSPIDEDQRFYLESRGVPRAAAERLIVRGFFDEVVSQLQPAAARDVIAAAIAAKLAKAGARV